MAKETPEFDTDEETAKFWDEHDSSEYMEDAEWGQFEWLPAEDRCESCGGRMEGRIFGESSRRTCSLACSC